MSEGPLIRPGHLFSQHSLATYVRCPRRFLLKYVDRQPWPMPEDRDPLGYQKHLERGRVFHQWMVRHQLGIDMDAMAATCGDSLLEQWWRAARGFDWTQLPADLRESEISIVVPIGPYRLYARFDLVALDRGGRAVVVDWKTLESRPSERTLRTRMQTRIYLYTLVASGSVLTGGQEIDPSQAHMVYWFANYPDEPADIRYSDSAHAAAERDLTSLVEEISSRRRNEFQQTQDVRFCTRCNYRSLCDRIDESPLSKDPNGWLDEDIDFALDLDETDDLEY